ncbi:MAG: hypothetical protein OXT51_00640 [Chloroflexota bacterium]|nr:hypothetical protein [Chloroflexota bacterium]
MNSLVQQGSTNQSPARNGGGIGVLAIGSVETSPANVRVSALTLRSVPENSVEDVKVGSPILAGDTGNNPITFSLQGADAAHFKIESIDARSAQLLVGPDAGLDYEVKNVYLVDVVVMDAGGDVSTVNIQVDIEDVRLPGRADEFDVANNHDEHLDREEVEAAHEALQLRSLTRTEMTFIVDYYYSTNFPPIDINNIVSIVDEYDLNEDSIIDRSEVMEALDDYRNGEITKADMREILKVHFITA